MMGVLDEVLKGTYDIELAKKWFVLEQKFMEAFLNEDAERALKAADEMIALKPDRLDGWERKIVIYAAFKASWWLSSGRPGAAPAS